MTLPQKAPPFVLIGIPTFRRPRQLAQLVATIEAMDKSGRKVEIFIADNDPARREGLKFCETRDDATVPIRCRLVPEPGIAAARNAILEDALASEAEYLVMFDDDEMVHVDFLSEILRAQRETGADATAGVVECVLENDSPAAEQSGLFFPPRRTLGTASLLPSVAAVLLSLGSLRRAGEPKFDLRLGTSGGEDTDFMLELRDRGFSFAWAPSAIVKEWMPKGRLTPRAVLRLAFQSGANGVRIMIKRRLWRDLVMAISKAVAIFLFAPLMLTVLLSPARRYWLLTRWAIASGRFAGLLGYRKAYYGALANREAAIE